MVGYRNDGMDLSGPGVELIRHSDGGVSER